MPCVSAPTLNYLWTLSRVNLKLTGFYVSPMSHSSRLLDCFNVLTPSISWLNRRLDDRTNCLTGALDSLSLWLCRLLVPFSCHCLVCPPRRSLFCFQTFRPARFGCSSRFFEWVSSRSLRCHCRDSSVACVVPHHSQPPVFRSLASDTFPRGYFHFQLRPNVSLIRRVLLLRGI